MAGSKAPKKEALKKFKGLKKFTILKETNHLKKGQEVELTFNMYEIFFKKKLV